MIRRLLIVKLVLLVLGLVLAASPVPAQRTAPPSKAELAEITERGRRLAEYDFAAWHATDAVRALNPTTGSFTRYVAKKADQGWTVVFGRFNEKRDRFLIVYEAIQGSDPKEFKVKKYDNPLEDSGFYLAAARAIESATANFTGESRPYNAVVLPLKSGQWHVYLVPAQTEVGIYPLGADARYLVSQDGSKIVEKRQLHKAIIEFSAPPEMQRVEAGYHIAVLDDIPEDTDVFHVLVREPRVPQWVATRKYVYRIEVDGTISYVTTVEEFFKERDKPR